MQHSTVLVVLAALVVCCAADYGSVILFPFGRLRVEGHEHDNGVITGCDDCSTKAIPVHYNPVRIDGEDYEAFAVHSNGYITLYPNKNSKVIPYLYSDLRDLLVPSYDPPIIAPLWSDVDLYCEAYHSEENTVYFEETTDPASLFVAASIVAQRTGDVEFRPQSMLIFTWDTVQPYDCPEDIRTNTFQLVVAMERIPSREDTPSPLLTRTYVIMLYRALGWMSSDTGDLPVIGVGGVRSSEAVPLAGVNDTLINGDASGIVVYRVDEEDDIQLYYPISFTAKAQDKSMKDVVMEKNPKKKGKVALIQDLIQENLDKYKKRGH